MKQLYIFNIKLQPFLTSSAGHQVHSASAYCHLMLIYVGKIWHHLQKQTSE